MNEYDDYPLEELSVTAREVMADGGSVYFKWTCDACGERVTSDEMNILFTQAEHTDCPVTPGYVTDTKAKGGNYLIIRGPGAMDFLAPDAIDEFEAAYNADYPRYQRENPIIRALTELYKGGRPDDGGQALRTLMLEHRCPRCFGLVPNNVQPGEYPGALSRTTRDVPEDQWVFVCSKCGTEESLEEFAGPGLTPQSKWPLLGRRIGRFGIGRPTLN